MVAQKWTRDSTSKHFIESTLLSNYNMCTATFVFRDRETARKALGSRQGYDILLPTVYPCLDILYTCT